MISMMKTNVCAMHLLFCCLQVCYSRKYKESQVGGGGIGGEGEEEEGCWERRKKAAGEGGRVFLFFCVFLIPIFYVVVCNKAHMCDAPCNVHVAKVITQGS